MHSLALAITLVVGILAAFVAVAIALPRTRTPESVVSTLPPEILDRLRAFLGGVFQALLDDGRIDADEADDLREELVDGLQGPGDGVSLTEAVQWVGSKVSGVLQRDAGKIRERAAEHARKALDAELGLARRKHHAKRAAALREAAERVEARQDPAEGRGVTADCDDDRRHAVPPNAGEPAQRGEPDCDDDRPRVPGCGHVEGSTTTESCGFCAEWAEERAHAAAMRNEERQRQAALDELWAEAEYAAWEATL